MTRHTTIRRKEADGVFRRDDWTAGVPLTSEMCYTIATLVRDEIDARKHGHGSIPATRERLSTPCLERIAQLMDVAITDISVPRDAPQR